MVRSAENNDHYSNQTGHKARGEAMRTREEFRKVFKAGPYFSADQQRLAINQAPPLSRTEQYVNGRSMFRDPNSGRKRR